MIDIDKWFSCYRIKPKRKGFYMLVVGIKSLIGGWMDTSIMNAKWNGRVWLIADTLSPISWKIIKNGGM